MPYTIAVAVEEEGVGITAVSGVTVWPSPVDGAFDEGIGTIEMTPIGSMVPSTDGQVPVQFQIRNGGGNVNVDIVNMGTQKVVASRRFPNMVGSIYLGEPTVPVDAPAVTLWKSPTDSVWTLRVKSDGTRRTFSVDLMTQGDADFSGVSSVESGDRATRAGGLLSVGLTTSGIKQIQFRIDGTAVATLNIMSRLDGDGADTMFRPRFVFVGSRATAFPSFASIPLRNDAPVVWNWNRELPDGVGVVDSGIYGARVSCEGVSGAGYTEVVSTFNLVTPLRIQWGTTAEQLSETPAPSTVMMSIDGNDVAQVVMKPNKSVKWTTSVQNSAGQPVKLLGVNQIANPSVVPFLAAWDGTLGDGKTLAPLGSYRIIAVAVPNDGSPTQTFIQPVQVISDGRAVAALSDWIDLDAIAPRVIINGQPARVATGNSFLQWKVKPMGKWYPPIAFQAQMTLENMRQTVIGYPYVPFVTVAHRWFDTIHVVSQVTFRAGFMRHDYSTGYGWHCLLYTSPSPRD
ncbi:hypothetical protein EBZ35_08090, partial [bacterium]|nr:hypothetical protein [bacterium]